MTQNTPTIYQRLEKLEGELQKLTNTVYALKVTDIQNYDKNFEERQCCSSGGADCLPDA
jgi:hypothetical protein